MFDKLTRKQQAFITHYLTSLSIQEACDRVKITTRTFRNWKKNEIFLECLKEIQKEVMDEAIDKLKMAVTKAVDNLLIYLNSDDEKMKLLVSKDILTYFIKLMDILKTETLVTKIPKIEFVLAKEEDNETDI